MVNLFKNQRKEDKDSKVVSCDEAKDLLLSRTGLRITCPEDEDYETKKVDYDKFVKETDQKHAESLMKKYPNVPCEDAKKIVHDKLGVKYVCPEEGSDQE